MVQQKMIARWFLGSVMLAVMVIILLGQVSAKGNLYDQMVKVNKEWLKQSDVDPIMHELAPVSGTHAEIQTHLMWVEKVLRSRDVSDLSEELQANRLKHLNDLNAYWKAGNFPINTSHDHRLPIFIDPYENYCAVGHLLKASGNDAVAKHISTSGNFDYLEDMHYPSLMEWAGKSGLTLGELAWIQPSYTPALTFKALGDGTSGNVNALKVDHTTGNLYVAGDFDHAGGYSGMNNIAVYINNISGITWLSLGTGLNGPVYAVEIFDGGVYAAGHFSEAGGKAVSNIARFDGTEWHAVGALDGTVKCLQVYNGELYAGGSFNDPSTNNSFANFAKLSGNNWVSAGGSVIGEVLALHVFDDKLAIGGEFSHAGSASSTNIAFYDGSDFSDAGNGLPAKVRALHELNNKLYAGGDLYNFDHTEFFGLAEWDNSAWNVIVSESVFVNSTDGYFSSMDVSPNIFNGPELVIGGSFELAFGGKNLMHYGFNLSSNLDLDGPVNAVTIYADNLYFGGNFEKNGSTTLNNVGQADYDPFVGIDEESAVAGVKLFPNPAIASSNIEIVGPENKRISSATVYNQLGQPVNEFINPNESHIMTIPGHLLPAGSYFVQVRADDDIITSAPLIVN